MFRRLIFYSIATLTGIAGIPVGLLLTGVAIGLLPLWISIYALIRLK
jgi:hypothetical protein